jgi:hypothetical protein
MYRLSLDPLVEQGTRPARMEEVISELSQIHPNQMRNGKTLLHSMWDDGIEACNHSGPLANHEESVIWTHRLQ